MTQDVQATTDIHAGAVSPMRNAAQVGGLAAAGVLFSGGNVSATLMTLLGSALLAAVGSEARKRLRQNEAAGTLPNFIAAVFLNTAALLG